VVRVSEEGEKKFVQVGQLKEGSYLLIDDFPCQIKGIEKSKPGKHGSAKARITAFGIFDNQKRGLLKPTDADVYVPIVDKGVAQVVAVMGDSVQIMDTGNYQTYDVRKPSDVGGLESGVEVEYQKYGKSIRIVRKR
jgi:translation initiation factor 5A